MAGPAFKTALSCPITVLFRSVAVRRGTAAAAAVAPHIKNHPLVAATAPHIKNGLLAATSRHFSTTSSSRAPHVIPRGGPSKQPETEKGHQGAQGPQDGQGPRLGAGVKVQPTPHIPARAKEPAGQEAGLPKEPGLCSEWGRKVLLGKTKKEEQEEAEQEEMNRWLRIIYVAAPLYCLLSLYAINLFSKEIQAAREIDRKNGNELEVLDNLVVWLNHRPA